MSSALRAVTYDAIRFQGLKPLAKNARPPGGFGPTITFCNREPTHALRRRLRPAHTQEKPGRIPPHRPESWQNLARAWCARLQRMRRRRSRREVGRAVPENDQAQARRDGGVFVDRLQISPPPPPPQRQ